MQKFEFMLTALPPPSSIPRSSLPRCPDLAKNQSTYRTTDSINTTRQKHQNHSKHSQSHNRRDAIVNHAPNATTPSPPAPTSNPSNANSLQSQSSSPSHHRCSLHATNADKPTPFTESKNHDQLQKQRDRKQSSERKGRMNSLLDHSIYGGLRNELE